MVKQVMIKVRLTPATFTSVLALTGLSIGCGENIVGVLPDSNPTQACESAEPSEGPNAYPPCPYGGTASAILDNLVFGGYVSVSADGNVGDNEFTEEFSLQDIRTDGRFRYLFLNVAADWCQGCKIEAAQLPSLYDTWAPKGGYVMSVLIEDEAGAPATTRNLDRWTTTYAPNYTMVYDPQQNINFVLGPESLPMNVIVDLETMEILHRVVGEDLAIFDIFDSVLDGQ